MRKLFLSFCVLLAMASIGLIGYSTYTMIGGVSFPGVGNHFVPAPIVYDLEVSAGAGGEVNVVKGKYQKNQEVSLVATPVEGYSFVGWYDEDGNYITASKNYKFSITEKTNLFARFSKIPDEITGEAAYSEMLKDCKKNFEIIVHCDKDNAEEWISENFYIIDNDFIGTQFENIEFTVNKGENPGEYIVRSVNEYESGVNYTAGFRDSATDDDAVIGNDGATNNGQTLDFCIEQEEKTEIEQKEGIVFISYNDSALFKELVDDGLIEGEEGDQEDYLVLTNADGIEEGTIICVYNGETDENGNPVIGLDSLYGKCKSKQNVSGGVKIVYTFPELSEIFEIFNIFTEEEVDFEESDVEISDEVLGDVGYSFITSKSFQDYVAAATFAVRQSLEGTGYSVEPIASVEDVTEKIDVKATAQVQGTNAKVIVNATINLPLNDSAGKQVALLKLDLNYNKEIALTAYFNYTLRTKQGVIGGFKSYDVGQIVSCEDDCELKIVVLYGEDNLEQEEINKELIKDKCMQALHGGKNKVEKDKIAELFAQAGYACTAEKQVELFTVVGNDTVISYEMDVDLLLKFDVSGSLFYNTKTTSYARVGVRSQGNGKGKLYKQTKFSEASSEIVVSGDVFVDTGIAVESDIKLVGLAKYVSAKIGVATGVTITADGYINKQSGYGAGGYSVDGYNASTAQTKMFGSIEKFEQSETKVNVVEVGYNNSILYWANEQVEQDYVLGIIDKKTDLLDMDIFKVLVYKKNGKIKEEKLSKNSKDYNIEVVTNSDYLTYSNGKLEVSNGAPAFFRDTITIKVVARNAWAELVEDGYCAYLKEITITVEYGNQDDYYAAIDSDIEKEFRRLYRTYNEANAEVLDEMLTNLIDNFISVDVGDGKVFYIIVDEYINSIFAVIKDYRAQEDDIRTMENKFVKNEASSFVSILELFNNVSSENVTTEERLRELIKDIDRSDVLYTMLKNISSRADFNEYVGSVQVREEDIPTVENAFDWYREVTENPERTEEIISIIEHFFGMDE